MGIDLRGYVDSLELSRERLESCGKALADMTLLIEQSQDQLGTAFETQRRLKIISGVVRDVYFREDSNS